MIASRGLLIRINTAITLGHRSSRYPKENEVTILTSVNFNSHPRAVAHAAQSVRRTYDRHGGGGIRMKGR